MGQLGTAFYLLFAVVITFIAIRPAYRLFAPKIQLPPTSELIGIVTFLLILSPLSALLISVLSLPLIIFLAYAVSEVEPTYAAAIQRHMESFPSWGFLLCLFALIYLAVFLNGLHGYIKSMASRNR